MNVFEAIIIGLIQGLTEFLPISSSGHTIITAKLLDVEISLSFELFIHLASLLAVFIVLRKPIIEIIKRPLSKEARLLFVATIPTVIIVAVFKNVFESAFDGRWLPYCFLITAIMIMASGLIKPKTNLVSVYKTGYTDALIIGSVQGFAALPGISRSGSTISTAVLLGSGKTDAARFSFLLSIPIIIGSSAIELLGGIKDGAGLSVDLLPAICGFAAAFVSGFFALKFMLKKLNKYFDYFAIYLLALAVFLFLDGLFLHWL